MLIAHLLKIVKIKIIFIRYYMLFKLFYLYISNLSIVMNKEKYI